MNAKKAQGPKGKNFLSHAQGVGMWSKGRVCRVSCGGRRKGKEEARAR